MAERQFRQNQSVQQNHRIYGHLRCRKTTPKFVDLHECHPRKSSLLSTGLKRWKSQGSVWPKDENQNGLKIYNDIQTSETQPKHRNGEKWFRRSYRNLAKVGNLFICKILHSFKVSLENFHDNNEGGEVHDGDIFVGDCGAVAVVGPAVADDPGAVQALDTALGTAFIARFHYFVI